MERPTDTDRPFFAYGLFRPGQLAFFQLRDLVDRVAGPIEIVGSLRLRDGLPIIDLRGSGSVRGALLKFRSDRSQEAYDRISAMEPDRHYLWSEIQADGNSANVLIGRSPQKGSVPCEEPEWDGWTDPLFTAALDVVGETLESQEFNWNLKPLFRLQMAYLLLWSSIERYVSLRYHLGDRVAEKVRQLAHEPAFALSLQRRVQNVREVYRADRPAEKEVLDPQVPERAVRYYYQVRSNITHRGKAVVRDYERVHDSLAELLPIFRDVLEAARAEAQTALE